MSSLSVAASPFSNRVHYLPSPAISPFPAHPSSAPSTKMATSFSNANHSMASHPSSRFSVRAPPTSSLLHASPLTFSFSHAPSVSYRIASSSSPPFSPFPASVTGPQSQSVSVCASQPGPGGQRWPAKSKSLGNINERTVPAYQVSAQCHELAFCTRVHSPHAGQFSACVSSQLPFCTLHLCRGVCSSTRPVYCFTNSLWTGHNITNVLIGWFDLTYRLCCLSERAHLIACLVY